MNSVQPEHAAGSARASPGSGGRSEVLVFRSPHGVAALPAPCFICSHRTLCLPQAVDDTSLHALDGAVLDQRHFHRGQVLYREGDTLQQLYAVRSGSFKLAVAVGEEHDQISRICLSGDLLGLDGIARGFFGCTATALEDSQVCSISFTTLLDLARRDPQWQESLCHVMASEVARELRHMVLLGSYRTEARVAAFLLEVSGRLEERGFSRTEFHLRLSREEIGSYLGLTIETISRTLSTFQKNGWIELRKRHVKLLDSAGLLRATRGGASSKSRPAVDQARGAWRNDDGHDLTPTWVAAARRPKQDPKSPTQ